MIADVLDQVRFQDDRPGIAVLHNAPDFRVITIGLKTGQILPSHSSTSSVLMHVLQGRGHITAGEERHAVGPGAVVICRPYEPHGIEATEEMAVLAVIAPRP